MARTKVAVAGRPRRKKPWRPAQRLALSVRFIGGESTGSYIRRLADVNGIPGQEFWPMFGTPLRKEGGPDDPRYREGYLNAAALDRLVVMTGRTVGELQSALPNLRTERLLSAEGGPAWDWRLRTPGCFLVRACEVCAHIKGTGWDSYLAADATWQVCAAHGRWLDNRRDPRAAAIALSAVPEVANAHRLRVQLERRLGAGGRDMFADAYAIVSCWWNIPVLNAPVWQARRRALGSAGRDELRVAPLVFYPQAVHLAYCLAARERQCQRGALTEEADRAWLKRVTVLLEEWGIPVDGLAQVEEWRVRHPPTSSAPAGRTGCGEGNVERPARGRYRRLPLPASHTGLVLDDDSTFADHSCLSWRLGDLITRQLQPAPRGWSLGGRA
ncbi:hypothetical protein POF50_032395 [Streptomyces sp. SL13]|uniref:TniQ protein n=1 Tax=Streptantibioticus silvisoli TaxID=2705255 RepID=A0AA90K1N6_9ACTN|nr:hypothetical protein [Streptantibioticus silvisoli]MDI5973991.1 hypothetical protein [Streptantibioticus silvisoli]